MYIQYSTVLYLYFTKCTLAAKAKTVRFPPFHLQSFAISLPIFELPASSKGTYGLSAHYREREQIVTNGRETA
jgi:hypothetical protein